MCCDRASWLIAMLQASLRLIEQTMLTFVQFFLHIVNKMQTLQLDTCSRIIEVRIHSSTFNCVRTRTCARLPSVHNHGTRRTRDTHLSTHQWHMIMRVQRNIRRCDPCASACRAWRLRDVNIHHVMNMNVSLCLTNLSSSC